MTIKISHVSYTLKNVKILDDVSFDIVPGEILAIVGPNGAGKSSILNLVAGDSDPTQGDIFYNNTHLKHISLEMRASQRSVMSQSSQIIFDYTVREIVEMGWLERSEENLSVNLNRAITIVSEDCFITEILDRKFTELSGGEQRRVHLARTLLQLWQPDCNKRIKYLLLDEPLANLDLYYEIKLMELIKRKSREGIGILLIIHDLNLAAKFSDRVAIFSEGNLQQIGLVEQVFNKELLKSVYGIDIEVEVNPFRLKYY